MTDNEKENLKKRGISPCSRIAKCIVKSVNIRDFIARYFLFKPPSPPKYGLEEIFTEDENSETQQAFYILRNQELKYHIYGMEDFRLHAFKLYQNRETEFEERCVPMIYLKNFKSRGDILVIYSHGNASDLGDVYYYIVKIGRIYNADVVAYDYRGYGISQGETNEKSTYEDLENVLSFAINHLQYEIKQIVLWGFSLGTGPTIEIASRYQNIGGVVLQSPLASVHVWLDTNADWDYEYDSKDLFCSINKIESIRSKIFLIHGKNDKIIDVRHSYLLYEKYTKSKEENNSIWFVVSEIAGHNDLQYYIEDPSSAFAKRINQFLSRIRFANKYPFMVSKSKMDKKRDDDRASYLDKENNSLKICFDKISINKKVNSNISLSTSQDSNVVHRLEKSSPKEVLKKEPEKKVHFKEQPKKDNQSTNTHKSKRKSRNQSANQVLLYCGKF